MKPPKRPTPPSNRDDDLKDQVINTLEIRPEIIQDEFCKVPAAIATWAERHANAIGQSLRAEENRKQMEAALYLEFREEARSGGTKKTEAEIDASVRTDARFVASKRTEIEAEIYRVKMKGMADAVFAKKDMLVSLGAHIRQEMGGHPRINKPDFDEDPNAGLGEDEGGEEPTPNDDEIPV